VPETRASCRALPGMRGAYGRAMATHTAQMPVIAGPLPWPGVYRRCGRSWSRHAGQPVNLSPAQARIDRSLDGLVAPAGRVLLGGPGDQHLPGLPDSQLRHASQLRFCSMYCNGRASPGHRGGMLPGPAAAAAGTAPGAAQGRRPAAERSSSRFTHRCGRAILACPRRQPSASQSIRACNPGPEEVSIISGTKHRGEVRSRNRTASATSEASSI
jgi:hypothetical protein